jgi:hypothetical protein
MRLTALLIVLGTSSAFACTIPVFRFALDRWEADKFHLVLPPAVAKDSAVQDLLRPLRANGKANLDITTARDTAMQDAALLSSRSNEQQLWSGKLDQSTLNAVLDSPARQQIIRQILAGDSLIWVIADSGSALDAVEAERIEKRLKFLEQVASLPIQDPDDPDSQLGPGPPLRLKFTTLRLRRDDPAEQLLLRMLAGPRGDFDPATTSFAGVVFGRGRVLGAWPLTILDDTALENASMFLVGRCGCRLKNENPGWDLLLNIDWPKALAAVPTSAPPAEVAPPAPSAAVEAPVPAVVKAAAVPEVVKIVAEKPAVKAETGGGKGPLIAGVAAGLALLLLVPRWFKK